MQAVRRLLVFSQIPFKPTFILEYVLKKLLLLALHIQNTFTERALMISQVWVNIL